MTVTDLIDKLFHYGMSIKVIIHCYDPGGESEDDIPTDWLAEIDSVEFDKERNQVIIELKR